MLREATFGLDHCGGFFAMSGILNAFDPQSMSLVMPFPTTWKRNTSMKMWNFNVGGLSKLGTMSTSLLSVVRVSLLV